MGFCALVLAASAAAAKATFTKVKVPHANPTLLEVMNNHGALAGQYSEVASGPAFIRAPDGTFTTFAVDGAVSTIPRGLSDDGAVGGRYDLPDDSIHGFFRDPSGTLTLFDAPGQGAAEIVGMNAQHDILGIYFPEDGDLAGFIRHPDGSFSTFAVDGANPAYLSLAGLNKAGVAAGSYTDANFVGHGFLRQPNGEIDSVDAPGAGRGALQGTSVSFINDNGAVVGFYKDKHDALQAYLRKPDGTFHRVQLLPARFLRLSGLNNNGDVSGCYSSNDIWRGFIRKAGGKIVTFDLPWGNSKDMCTVGINDAGQVAGYVRYGSFGQKEFGFLRTP